MKIIGIGWIFFVPLLKDSGNKWYTVYQKGEEKYSIKVR